ncbi:hypothetical protein Gotri_013343 [Gossypium trilobum]|uniref:Uncharacterized protein n=1 Tax=Gossypium trilobum TaxID=34281 RepID=A0A7J9DTD3_9ROSI|nr:hypothetical protein [Gossypium trilobum]
MYELNLPNCLCCWLCLIQFSWFSVDLCLVAEELGSSALSSRQIKHRRPRRWRN